LFVAQDGVQAFWKDGTDAVEEVKIAKRWLNALRSRNFDVLAKLTQYPFELRDTAETGPCGTQRAATNAGSLRSAIDCLLSDDLVHGALEESRESTVRAALAKDDIAEWARRWWRRDVHAALWPVYVIAAKEGCCEFDFTLLVGKAGVQGFWKTGTVEAAEGDP
jgi:hypothetical protein